MHIAWFGLVGMIFSGTAGAGNEDPKPEMHALAAEVLTLEKFMATDPEFSAPGNDAPIKASLGKLNGHIANLTSKSFAEDPVLTVNIWLLRQHMTDATRAFEENNKPFARSMVQSSLQMCIACHTRKKAVDFPLAELDTAKMALLDVGDFYFATRQFQKGKAVFEALVSGYPKNKESQWNVRKALLALAVYYARITEDPRAGKNYFEAVSALETLPAYVREESAAWAKEFGRWGKEKAVNSDAALTEVALLSKARALIRKDDFSLISELGHSFHVRRLRASSLLHRVLEAPGGHSPRKAEALLYLGQIYPRISSNLFFRFGDLYLKACIQEYPKTSTAHACYTALELSVIEGYTGSGGTDIPKEEEDELTRLKRLAF
jgi:hypothetical protein